MRKAVLHEFSLFSLLMRILIYLLLFTSSVTSYSQSKVMRELSDTYPEAFVLMFYHSSLNMLNIDDDPEFYRMIRDIEKIKVVRIDKDEDSFNKEALISLKSSLKERGFEELMIIKNKEYDIGVYIHEDGDDIEGYFLTMDEGDTFMAIDVLGNMPVGDISQLINKIKQANDF